MDQEKLTTASKEGNQTEAQASTDVNVTQKQLIIETSRKPSVERWILHNRDTLTEERAEAVLNAQEHVQKIKHRGYWSFSLIAIVLAINVFSMAVVIFIGLGVMRFTGDLAIPSIIAVNFAETWALTRLAMKFYFDKPEGKLK